MSAPVCDHCALRLPLVDEWYCERCADFMADLETRPSFCDYCGESGRFGATIAMTGDLCLGCVDVEACEARSGIRRRRVKWSALISTEAGLG